MDNTPIVLAYSGGLDTSFCIPWIKENYGRDVITVTIDTGGFDEENKENIKKRAINLGAKQHYFCLLYTSPSPRDGLLSRMPSSA